MKVDVLVAEIGSTTTLANAFSGIDTDAPRFIGQGSAPTSVLEGDVRIGLRGAVADLRRKMGRQELTYGEMYATSSAAGGLRMTVHGLVYDMTVRAAEAAALGAGAIIRGTTAGKLTDFDLWDIARENPNLILLAGGTDYGERETALYNAGAIASLDLPAPVIYAGNCQNREQIAEIFEKTGIPCYITENVYPRLDELNIEPTRRIIHRVFGEHIVKAPGMEHVRDMVTGDIIPTPGAVMEAAQLLYNDIGDLAVVDIGGATTDVHSVTEGSEEIALLRTSPEPFAKRTVEGDLGLFVNAKNVYARLEPEGEMPVDWAPIPETDEQLALAARLAVEAGITAVNRHAGKLRYLYGPTGRQTIAEGKDLTQIQYLIGTGGALTRLPSREKILEKIASCNARGDMLYPKPGKVKLLYDDDYIMASLGVLSKGHPKAALQLMKNSLGI
jgi:conserved hypothetical protein